VDAGQLLERAQATALERPLLYALRFLERYVEVPSVLHDWVGRQQLGAVEFWLVQRVWADRRQGELGDVLWSFSIGGSLRRLFLFAADLVSSTGGVDAGISLPSRIAIPAGLCIAFGATAAARWAAVAQYGEKNIR
jgi:hypothetical protein